MKFYRVLVFVLLISLVCSGCGEVLPEYEYTEVYQRISAPYAPDFLFNGKVLQANVNGHIYEFHSSLSEKDRAAFITKQEALCSLLDSHGVATDGLTFRVLADYSNWTDSQNKAAYFGTNTTGTWMQALTTVQACLGDYTNYGYLYALSNRIAKDLKWQEDETGSVSAELFTKDSSLLNLVYPCFAEKYSDSETIAACKALAKELLSATGDIWSEAEFLSARTTYAKNNGIAYTPTTIAFAFYSESCPLKLTSKYMEVFWDYTFVANNEYRDEMIPKDYTEDTAGLIHTFQWLDEQLTELCSRLNAEPTERIPVQMMGAMPDGYASIYFESGGLYYYDVQQGRRQIAASTVTVLAHEYMHHIYWLLTECADPGYEGWHNEVIAYYYTLGHQYEYRVNVIKYVDPDYGKRLERRLGEPYDEPSDYIKFLRIAWRDPESPKYLYSLKTTHDLCSAFGEYFVRTYGEEAFLNSMLAPSKVKEYTGKSMNAILDDWCVDMADPAND